MSRKIFALALTVLLLIVVQNVHATVTDTLAPNFSMTGLNNNTFSLSSFIAGKVALLEFFHCSCPYCQNETGELNTVLNNFGNKITMLSVSQDPGDWSSGNNGTFVTFINNYHVTWTLAEDTYNGVNLVGWGLYLPIAQAACGCGGAVPTIFIIDQTGYVRFVNVATPVYPPFPASMLIGEIDALLTPSVVITSPMSASPAYTRSGLNVNVGWNYGETNPANATITIYNATATVGQTFVTLTTGGGNVSRLDSVTMNSGTSDGTYNVRVTMYNLAGSMTQAVSLNSVIVDTTVPTVSIGYPSKGAYLNSSTVWVNGTVTDANIGSRQPSINASGFTLPYWNAGTGSFGFKNSSSLPQGLLSVRVNFADVAGNNGSDTTYFIMDTVAPVLSITYPSSGAYLNSSTVWVNGTVTEANMGSNVPMINDTRFSRSYWNNITGIFGFKNSASLPDGRLSVTVNFTDLAGNTNVTSTYFILDTTAPVLSITYPSAGAYLNSSTVWVNGTVTDVNMGSNMPSINASGFSLSYWNATSGKFGFKNTSVSDGTLSVKVTFMDTANNTGFASTYFTVDTTKPVVSITYPSAGAYLNSSTVWVNGTVTDANMGGNQPSINDSRFALQYWNATTGVFGFKNSSSVPDGPLSVTVNFADLAGNAGNASKSFTLDTTAPVVSIAYPTDGAYVDLASTMWVNGTVTELNMGTLKPSMNDTRFNLTSWNSSTGSFGFSNNTAMSEDSVLVMVSFTDLAGNRGMDTVTFSLGVPTSSTCLVVQGLDNGIYYRTSSGDSWGDWNVLPGATGDGPAAAVYQNNLYIVVRGMDGNTLWYGSVDLSTNAFTGWSPLDGATTSAPTLTSNGTVLCLVVRGEDNRIYYRCYNGSWGSWYAIPTGSTPDSPAAAMLGNNLHIVVRGMDNSNLWDIIVACNGTIVRNWMPVSGATSSRPALASQGSDTLFLVVRGLDNSIYYRSYTGSTDSWGDWNVLPGATVDGPGATVSNTQLYVVVRGADGNTLWCWDGSSWTMLNGATSSAPALTS